MKDPLTQTLALLSLPGCGAATYWKLQEAFGSLDKAFDSEVSDLAPFLSEDAICILNEYRNKRIESTLQAHVERELEYSDKHQIKLVTPSSSDFPGMLKEIKRYPPLLYVKGDVSTLALPQIAIVGSRKPTPSGQALASEFAAQLSKSGFVITSGLALGIDAQAHRGVLTNKGRTIAVLGSGLFNIYPQRNQRLAEDILAHGGALVSEFPLNSLAKAHHFPQRNRIVSGLSCGVLVVEAALKSGSLITARFALQQDREVFAIPGSIRSEVSRGCHAMIKSGAKLVETPRDVVEELSGVLGFYKDQIYLGEGSDNSKQETLSPQHKKILDAMCFDVMPLDAVSKITEMTRVELLEVLMDLELAGMIENTGLGFVKIN